MIDDDDKLTWVSAGILRGGTRQFMDILQGEVRKDMEEKRALRQAALLEKMTCEHRSKTKQDKKTKKRIRKQSRR